MGRGREDRVFVVQDAQFLVSAVDSFRLAFEHSMHRVEAVEVRMEAQSQLLQALAEQINALNTANQAEQCANCSTQLTTEIQKAIHDVAHSVMDEVKVELQSVIDRFGKVHHSELEERNDGSLHKVAQEIDSRALSIDDEHSCIGTQTPSEQSIDGESKQCDAMVSTISSISDPMDSQICMDASRSEDASPVLATQDGRSSIDQDTTPQRNLSSNATEAGSDTLQTGLALSTSMPRPPLPVSSCPQPVSVHQLKGAHENSEQCCHMRRSHATPRVQSMVESYSHKGAANVSVGSHSFLNSNKSALGSSRVKSAISQWERRTSCGPAAHQHSTA